MDKDHPYIPQRGRPRKSKEEESVSEVLKKSELDKVGSIDIKKNLGFNTDRSYSNIVLEPIVDKPMRETLVHYNYNHCNNSNSNNYNYNQSNNYNYNNYNPNNYNPNPNNQSNTFNHTRQSKNNNIDFNNIFSPESINSNINNNNLYSSPIFNTNTFRDNINIRDSDNIVRDSNTMRDNINIRDNNINLRNECNVQFIKNEGNIKFMSNTNNLSLRENTINSLRENLNSMNKDNLNLRENINLRDNNINLRDNIVRDNTNMLRESMMNNNNLNENIQYDQINKFTGTSLGQTLSHLSNASNFDTDPNNLAYQNYSLWVNRKKRKNNPLLWQYINQSFVHPSKFSSVDYVQKRFLGTFTQPVVEKSNYQVLPLFLNSSSHSNEFDNIAKMFLERTSKICYDNITVMQLKNLMKEFGLCHNGKKTELIERVKMTVDRIRSKLRKEEKKEEVVQEEEFSYF